MRLFFYNKAIQSIFIEANFKERQRGLSPSSMSEAKNRQLDFELRLPTEFFKRHVKPPGSIFFLLF